MATAIGALSGYAVVKFAGGRKGLPLQVIAVVASLLGIAIGKYATFYHFFRQAAIETVGPEVASEITVLSPIVVETFFENFSLLLSGFDLLWVILAVAAAWRIPKSLGISVPGDAMAPRSP
jgi:hypothetical protein